jgi:hypothetical protein
LHLRQFTGLLQTAQGGDDRVKQVQQDQQAILIKVQFAIAGAVACAALVVQPCQKGRKLVEVLQPGDVPLRDVLAPLARHGLSCQNDNRSKSSGQGANRVPPLMKIPGANGVPNTIGTQLFSGEGSKGGRVN